MEPLAYRDSARQKGNRAAVEATTSAVTAPFRQVQGDEHGIQRRPEQRQCGTEGAFFGKRPGA